MSTILMAFGIGLAWAIGVIAGAALAMRWIPKNQKRYEQHLQTTEDRLAIYADNTARIADALESIKVIIRERQS